MRGIGLRVVGLRVFLALRVQGFGVHEVGFSQGYVWGFGFRVQGLGSSE